MTTVKEIESLNKIDQNEFDSISRILFDPLLIKHEYKDSSVVKKKAELIDILSIFLTKYLELHIINSRQDKLALINFIDKLNMQKELLELYKGQTNVAEIQLAARQLGKKSQSSVKRN